MGARDETLRVSIYFFLLFTPFSSYMTILTHIYEDANLPGIGPATLACNYGAFILSTLIAPSVKLPLKLQLVLAGICYTINYSSGIFALMTDVTGLKFLISCGAAAFAGFSAAFLWVSQGRYIHLVCQKYNVLDKKGEMFGIFSSIYCFSGVSAGFITTFGLGFFSSQIYFVIITVLGVISVLFCLFFVNNIQEKVKDSEKSNQQDILTDKSQSVALINEEVVKQQSLLTSVKKMILFLPAMYAVLPILVIDGFSLGIFSSQIPHLIPPNIGDKDLINKYAGIEQIILGAGSTVGGYLCGIFADKFGVLASGRIGIISWLLSVGTFVLALLLQQLWMAFVASCIWGFALFYIQGWMYIVCSKCYGGQPQAFSVNKQLHCILYLLFQIIVLVTDNKLPLVPLVSGAAILAIPALLFMNKIPVPTQDQKKK